MRRVLYVLLTLVALGGHALTAQEATERVHRVQTGETLSSIARAYFGDVASWRVIYEANRDRIPNPNQIEPGLELRIPGAAGAAVRTVEVTTQPAPPVREQRRATPAPRPAPPVEPSAPRTAFWSGPARTVTVEAPLLARAEEVAMLRPTVPVDAFQAAGWLLEVDEPTGAIGRVQTFSVASGVRSTRMTAQPFDLLHVRLDNPVAVRPGDMLQTFRIERRIKDLGDVVVPTGVLEVLRLEGDGVVAEVAEEYQPLRLGDWVKVPEPFGLRAGVTPEATGQMLDTRILAFQRQHELQLLGDVMFLDVGRADGVVVGDEFIGYLPPAEGWEPEPIGRVQILGVREHRSSARILSIDTPAFTEGLVLHLSRKMP
ncbi:MAG: LysM peptidoglycan-binding domain-containing protein [Gemmatimonadota bacterium]